ncbi:MAG: EthD family reductase [Chloroflexi bacterium]|nr:EthD family reductase [Chloroflexota bacterium]MBV9602481.1 EthD family reductase [Chloroflexota bacterium]
MIKIISAANLHPTNRGRDEFFRYWRERHGPLFAHTPRLRRYVQHFSLPEAYASNQPPTHDGASMFWYDDLDALRDQRSPTLAEAITAAEPDLYAHYVVAQRYGDPNTMTLQDTVRADDRQLFDRSVAWPVHARRATVVAQERVVVDGPTTPDMVKVLYTASKKPGLSTEEFTRHWFEVHGQLCARVAGLRRYVQNHGIPEAHPSRAMTHDGFSELWFDDLESLQRARASAEWAALSEDGQTLFAYPMSIVVAREGVIKG